jgi:hypothetical protein
MSAFGGKTDMTMRRRRVRRSYPITGTRNSIMIEGWQEPLFPSTEVCMTNTDQLAVAVSKVQRWEGKREHATAMLAKWRGRLDALQAKVKREQRG